MLQNIELKFEIVLSVGGNRNTYHYIPLFKSLKSSLSVSVCLNFLVLSRYLYSKSLRTVAMSDTPEQYENLEFVF